METSDSIYFYGLKNKYSFMSNFYKCNFTDENQINFNCSEQYFMYNKCLMFDPTNQILINKILNENSASKIKQYGRKVGNYNEQIWSKQRYNIMFTALKLKFSQNQDIKQKLIMTGNKTLYEASKYDKIWGIGFYANDVIKINKNKYGNNLLGKALIQVRQELINL